MRKFTDEKWLVPGVAAWLHRQAFAGEGNMARPTVWDEAYRNRCRAFHLPTGTLAIFTRDTGHHSSGWWKNPDYERCLHLSLSFYGAEGQPCGRDKALSDEWVTALFGATSNLVWSEPPVSEHGKRFDVWHYRVFYADPGYRVPILPRGEVYSKEFTEAGWLSYSELKAKQAKEAAEQEGRGA